MRVMDSVVALAVGFFMLCAVSLASKSRGALGGLLSRLRRAGKAMASLQAHPGKPPPPAVVRRELVRDMPTFLDIVTLGLEAGLSFDASLELYCKRFDTALSKRMREALLSWRMGAEGRAEALTRFASESGSQALGRFAATVSEALAFGTPLADALKRQASLIRDEQRSQIEEEIEKTPVKLLIPLGTLIMPAMLAAILGPLLGPALGLG